MAVPDFQVIALPVLKELVNAADHVPVRMRMGAGAYRNFT
jgi:hypothetical protein